MTKITSQIICKVLIMLSVSSLVYAQTPTLPTAKVIKLLGEVTFNGKALTKEYTIDSAGVLITGVKSFVQLRVEKWRNIITIGPKSKMILDLKSANKYLFDEGSCRWSSDKNKDDANTLAKKANSKKIVSTNFATMAIRGTDFIIKANNNFGETEVYMLDGEIEFKNIKDPEDLKIIKARQWVGVGGRFGSKISPVLQLSKQTENTIREEFSAFE